MKKRMKNETHTTVAAETIGVISKKLRKGLGHIVIAEPGHQSFEGDMQDVCIDLYDRPLIGERAYLTANRGLQKIGNEDHQTGWEDDRHYWLKKNSKPSEDPLYRWAESMHSGLPVGPFRLEISMQATVGRCAYPKRIDEGIALYVPRTVSIAESFRYAFDIMIDKMRIQEALKRELQRGVDSMVRYMMADLKDRSVLMNNIHAGAAADAAFGM